MLDRIDVAAMLAHDGGWDEILLVGAPILIFVVLLTIVKRRVDRETSDDNAR